MNHMTSIDPQLWQAFAKTATKQRKKPETVLANLIREYLEMYEDQALFDGMRRDLRGRSMTDDEIVEFVHQYRREKRLARTGRKK